MKRGGFFVLVLVASGCARIGYYSPCGDSEPCPDGWSCRTGVCQRACTVVADCDTLASPCLGCVCEDGWCMHSGFAGCPDGYVLAPTGAFPGAPATFCVAKYEMKDDGSGNAVAAAAGTPWVFVDQDAARNACRQVGPGFDLIDNNQWMTLAADIEQTGSNWHDNNSGGLALNNGNAYEPSALAAATDDTDGCFGVTTACGPDASAWRVHTLSNGEVLWDLSGNVREWVDWTVIDDRASPLEGWQELLDLVPTAAMPAESFRPVDPTLDVHNGVGQYYGGTNGIGGAAMRGGCFNDRDTRVGIYSLVLNNPPTFNDQRFGFRCVWEP